MSMLKEYADQEKERLEDAKKSKDHYLKVDLPGTRTFEVQTESVRQRIAAMKKEKAKPNHNK